MIGARYAICIDGQVRTNRDVLEVAIEAADLLKSGNPYSKIAILDRLTGTTTEVEGRKPGMTKDR
jgi:hypothetical protein